MKRAKLTWLLSVLLALNPFYAASWSEAAQGSKLVTPVEQTQGEQGATLAAPANARPPAEIDVSDLKPTLFKPMVELLEAIRARQEEAFATLDELAAKRSDDRTDEVLAAVRAISERKVTVQGWAEQRDAFNGLRAFLEPLRDRLERVATVEDVQDAVGSIQFPEPPEYPEIDFQGVAREETLLAFGDRFPTVENVREISANVASLTARLDGIAAQVEEVDLNAKVETLEKRLEIATWLIGILLALFLIQGLIIIGRWLASMTKAAKERAVAANNAWLEKKFASFLAKQNADAESTGKA